MTQKEFATAYSRKLNVNEKTAKKYIESMVEIMYEEFEKSNSVSIKNLRYFYCRKDRLLPTKSFKFTPARKIKDVLGWG